MGIGSGEIRAGGAYRCAQRVSSLRPAGGADRGPAPMASVRPIAALALLNGALVACAAKRGGAGGVAVQAIHFEGNGALFSDTGDYQLRQAMEQKQNPNLTWLRPRRRRVMLDRDTLSVDSWRIETWYAHRGYFDARFLGWELVPHGEGKDFLFWHPPPSVRIVGHVDEGPVSTVRALTWDNTDSTTALIIRLLERELSLKKGERFDIATLHEARDLAQRAFQDRGYPLATVVPTVDVFPDEKAVDVHLRVELGPRCVIGEISIKGARRVREDLVRQALSIEKGDLYSVSKLSSTQRRLFGLGVFSVVNVIPDVEHIHDNPDPKGAKVLPVRIELTESRFRQIRLGGGLESGLGQLDAHVSADFDHANLFGDLVKLTVENQLGYTSLAPLEEATDLVEEVTSTGETTSAATEVMAGPTLHTQAALTAPIAALPGWQVGLAASYEVGVEEGYTFRTPELSPSLTARFGKSLTLGLSYHYRYFDYLTLLLSDDDLRKTPLGLDFSDPYTLSHISQTLTYDVRDDILFPRSGGLVEYHLSEAGGPVQGDYSYIKVEGDHRGYLSLARVPGIQKAFRGSSAVVAGRIGGGFIQPYGSASEARVPFAERLYLGGSTSVRGWRQDHLGPYLCDPDWRDVLDKPRAEQLGADLVTSSFGQGTQPVGCALGALGTRQETSQILPIGGLVSLYTGAELRMYKGDGLGFALFSDAGMAWLDLDSARLSTLQPSVGGGLRYKSPVGPVRLDLAMRLGDEAMYALEPRFGFHFSISEAY